MQKVICAAVKPNAFTTNVAVERFFGLKESNRTAMENLHKLRVFRSRSKNSSTLCVSFAIAFLPHRICREERLYGGVAVRGTLLRHLGSNAPQNKIGDHVLDFRPLVTVTDQGPSLFTELDAKIAVFQQQCARFCKLFWRVGEKKMLARLDLDPFGTRRGRNDSFAMSESLENFDTRPATKPYRRDHYRSFPKVFGDIRNRAGDEDGSSIVELKHGGRGILADDEKLYIRSFPLDQRQNAPGEKERRIRIWFVRHVPHENYQRRGTLLANAVRLYRQIDSVGNHPDFGRLLPNDFSVSL